MITKPANSILSDLPRILLVAVVLPAVIVGVDQVAADAAKSVAVVRMLMPLLFIWQVGVLAACAGRFVTNVWLRVVVFAWSLMLVDAVALTTMFYGHGTASQCLMFALISGQIGLATVWGIMSRLVWQIRIPIYAGLLLALVIILMRSEGSAPWRNESGIWAVILGLQSVVMVGICCMLRFAGYRLLPAARDAADLSVSEREQFQFSIKHAIFWTTAVCPILALAKGVDWFVLDSQELSSAVELGLAMAVVSWVAMLCALGASPLAVRLPLLIVAPPVIGWVLMLVISSWTVMWMSSRSAWLFVEFREFGRGWVVWCALAAWFLAAQLLVFRSAGYTVARSRTLTNTAPGQGT